MQIFSLHFSLMVIIIKEIGSGRTKFVMEIHAPKQLVRNIVFTSTVTNMATVRFCELKSNKFNTC